MLLDLAPVVLDAPIDPMAAVLALLRRATVELHPATNLGVPAGEATAEAGRPGPAGRGARGFVVDATDGPRPRAPPTSRSSAGRWPPAATYLRALTDAGLTVDEAAALVEFRYAATDEQFPTIAKLRAARRLWARVLELSGARRLDRCRSRCGSTPSPAGR